MNIKSAKYTAPETAVLRNIKMVIEEAGKDKELFVPIDVNNRHYIELTKQVEEGKVTIEEAD